MYKKGGIMTIHEVVNTITPMIEDVMEQYQFEPLDEITIASMRENIRHRIDQLESDKNFHYKVNIPYNKEKAELKVIIKDQLKEEGTAIFKVKLRRERERNE